MGLSLAEIKDLILFGRAQCLQSLSVEGCAVTFGAPVEEPAPVEAEKPVDDVFSALPEELRHYSALGKQAMGKVAR